MSPPSKITGGQTRKLFSSIVLGKYPVTYWQCCETDFVQTDDPFWLAEAYTDPITSLDLGLVTRNFDKSKLTENFINRSISTAKQFLDFGGGYGMFTRLMRDKGFDFLHYDENCQNLFARDFEVENLSPSSGFHFDLITAWEVFEHVPEPRSLLESLLSVSGSILFSTELLPSQPIKNVEDWWYFVPETGQHVSFYSKQSLERLASDFDVFFYTDGGGNHAFSKARFERDPFGPVAVNRSRLGSMMTKLGLWNKPTSPSSGRTSLLVADFELALSKLRSRD